MSNLQSSVRPAGSATFVAMSNQHPTEPAVSSETTAVISNLLAGGAFITLWVVCAVVVYSELWSNPFLGLVIWGIGPITAFQRVSFHTAPLGPPLQGRTTRTANRFLVAMMVTAVCAAVVGAAMVIGAIGVHVGTIMFGVLYLISYGSLLISGSLMMAEEKRFAGLRTQKVNDLRSAAERLATTRTRPARSSQNVFIGGRLGDQQSRVPNHLLNLTDRHTSNPEGSFNENDEPLEGEIMPRWEGTRQEGIRLLTFEIEDETIARIGVTRPMAAQIAPAQAKAAWGKGRRPDGYAPAAWG